MGHVRKIFDQDEAADILVHFVDKGFIFGEPILYQVLVYCIVEINEVTGKEDLYIISIQYNDDGRKNLVGVVDDFMDPYAMFNCKTFCDKNHYEPDHMMKMIGDQIRSFMNSGDITHPVFVIRDKECVGYVSERVKGFKIMEF